MHPELAKNISPVGPGSCKSWLGPTYDNGNPKINFSGQTFGVRRLLREIDTGKKVKGSVFMDCGNTTCVNVEHMFEK